MWAWVLALAIGFGGRRMIWILWLLSLLALVLASWGVKLRSPWPGCLGLGVCIVGLEWHGNMWAAGFLGVALALIMLVWAVGSLRLALRRRRLIDPAYSWPHQLLLALDQGVNSLLLGYAEETISARCYRMQSRSRFWRRMLRIVDRIFARWERDHCLKSWQSEQRGTQLPPDYRAGREAGPQA